MNNKTTGKDEDGFINFDLNRMKEAVEAPSVEIPHFNTSGELREWIMNLTDEDFE